MTEEQIHELKHKLQVTAREKYPDDTARQQAYLYGTLRKLGWKPERENQGTRPEGPT